MYYEKNMELKQTDKVSDDGNFIISFPAGMEEYGIKEPIDKRISLKDVCGGDWTKLDDKYIESLDYDSNKNTYNIKFNTENLNNGNTELIVVEKRMKIEVNETFDTVDNIVYNYIIKRKDVGYFKIQNTIKYDLNF
ncbi:MAG: hypothetical protein Q4B86_04695 [Eubacteriales bacterium]|nr:hypothetical protein [Eubacteriales bacterium]